VEPYRVPGWDSLAVEELLPTLLILTNRR
jgi:hypothetical protein